MAKKKEKDKKKKTETSKPEQTYTTTMTFNCPIRGLVSQEVVVKRYHQDAIGDHETAHLTHNKSKDEVVPTAQ